jgi:hypothetical protein
LRHNCKKGNLPPDERLHRRLVGVIRIKQRAVLRSSQSVLASLVRALHIDAYVNVLAADMKGEGHGFRNYSDCQQHALSWIHLFHRQPHLAYMTNDAQQRKENKKVPTRAPKPNRRCM